MPCDACSMPSTTFPVATAILHSSIRRSYEPVPPRIPPRASLISLIAASHFGNQLPFHYRELAAFAKALRVCSKPPHGLPILEGLQFLIAVTCAFFGFVLGTRSKKHLRSVPRGCHCWLAQQCFLSASPGVLIPSDGGTRSLASVKLGVTPSLASVGVSLGISRSNNRPRRSVALKAKSS